MSGWRGIRYTDLKKILYPGRERDGPPNGGRGGFRSRRGCAPHFLFETSKRKCAAPGGKENMFGGSACAGAALLPPAGEGWQSLAAVRDGNAPPLGKPPARGGTGIPPCPSPRCRSRSREEAGSAWRSGRRRKRSWSNASLHPDAVGTIRHGTAVTTSQKMIACPKASPNRRLHRYADPRQHRGANAPACAKSGLFFWTGHCPAILMAESTRAADCRPCGASGRKPPLWGRGSKKRRPALRPAAPRSVFMPKIP